MGKRGSVIREYFSLVKVLAVGMWSVYQKFRLNIPDSFGRIRALLKSVGVEPWHVYVK
jgi:hypothetical protein